MMVDGVLWEGWMVWNRMGWFLLIMTVSLSILQVVWIRGISFGILGSKEYISDCQSKERQLRRGF